MISTKIVPSIYCRVSDGNKGFNTLYIVIAYPVPCLSAQAGRGGIPICVRNTRRQRTRL